MDFEVRGNRHCSTEQLLRNSATGEIETPASHKNARRPDPFVELRNMGQQHFGPAIPHRFRLGVSRQQSRPSPLASSRDKFKSECVAGGRSSFFSINQRTDGASTLGRAFGNSSG